MTPYVRLCLRARSRICFLFSGEFQAREGRSFATNLIVHDPLPRVGAFVVRKGCVKVAVFALEEEGDVIAVALSVADGIA
jgi:hypothetical protein